MINTTMPVLVTPSNVIDAVIPVVVDTTIKTINKVSLCIQPGVDSSVPVITSIIGKIQNNPIQTFCILSLLGGLLGCCLAILHSLLEELPSENKPTGKGPSVEGEGSIVESEGPIVESEGPIVESEGPIVESEGSIVEGEGPIVESEGSNVGSAKAKPEDKTTEVEKQVIIIRTAARTQCKISEKMFNNFLQKS